MFKSLRSQSSISSISDALACGATSEGQSDLSVSGMKLRSERNIDGDEGRNAEAGAAKVTPTDAFEEGEQTLIRSDPWENPAMTLNGKGKGNPIRPRSVPRPVHERNCCSKGCPNRRQRAIVRERNNPL